MSCYSPYDGYIYAVKKVLDTTDNTESYSIVRIDFNTSDMEEIYSPEDKADVIDCMTVSNDGRLFFSQGHFTGGNTDENGFCKDLHKTHLAAVDRDGDHLKLGSVHGLVGRIVGDDGGDGVAEGFAIGGHPHFDLGGSEDPSVGYVGETKHYIAEADAFAEFDVGLKVVS